MTTDEENAMLRAFYDWLNDHDWDGTHIPVVPGVEELRRCFRVAWIASRRYQERQGAMG